MIVATEDMNRMLVEIVTGKPPSRTDHDAMVMRAKLQRECDAIMSRGGMVEIPSELPELSTAGRRALYSPDQPRDDHGRFGEGDGSSSGMQDFYGGRAPQRSDFASDANDPGLLLGGQNANLETRMDAKIAIVNDISARIAANNPEIAEKLGDDRLMEYTNTVIGQWAQTSGDSVSGAVAYQLAAAKEFGLKDAELSHLGGGSEQGRNAIMSEADNYLRNDVARWAADAETNADSEFGRSDKTGVTGEEFMRASARAQYEATQEFFKSRGIESVVLARGYTAGSGASEHSRPFESIERAEARLQPLSSFSDNLDIAAGFGQYMFVVHVPVSQVFSTARTGNGCLTENEFVLFGGRLSALAGYSTRMGFDEVTWDDPGPDA